MRVASDTVARIRELRRVRGRLLAEADRLAPLVERRAERVLSWTRVSYTLQGEAGSAAMQRVLGGPLDLSAFTSPRARLDAGAEARALTIAFADFARGVLQALGPDEVKIALFADHNIIGCMFDRTPANYRLNARDLRGLLDVLGRFRDRLYPDHRAVWDSCTFCGGDDQVARFAGFVAEGESAAEPSAELDRLRALDLRDLAPGLG